MKFHNIRDVIKVLSKSNEEIVTLKYENILVRMLSVPVLLLGSIMNFVVMYLISEQHSIGSFICSVRLRCYTFLLFNWSYCIDNINYFSSNIYDPNKIKYVIDS